MTTGVDIQTAINRLVRSKQARQSKVITRPPIRGTSGSSDTGTATDALASPEGFVYVPFADEAAYGWGAPFDVNPPMGTVQTSWAPSNLIYRVIGQVVLGSWQVTHQRSDVACGSQWWRDSEGSLISWRPIAGWRDLAANQANVPVGAQPIFQGGDVLVYLDGVNRICAAVHAGGQLYVAHLGHQGGNDLKPFVSRAVVTLGGGFQSVVWETIGPIEEPSVDDKEFDAHHIDLRSDGAQCVINALTYLVPDSNGSDGRRRYYEEYTADLAWGSLGFTLMRTGDSDAGYQKRWYESAPGDSSAAARAEVQNSSMPFASNPPIQGAYDHYWNINFASGRWAVTSYLLSWYERNTDVIRRLTVDLDLRYEQHLQSQDNFDQRLSHIVPADNVLACDINDACVLFDDPSALNAQTAFWGEDLWQLSAKMDLTLKYGAAVLETIRVLDQTYEDRRASGTYAIVAETSSLPCTGPQELPCIEWPDLEGSKAGVEVDPGVSGAGEIIQGYTYPPDDVFNDLNYEINTEVLPFENGDPADAKGMLFQYGWDMTVSIVNNVDQLSPGRSRRYWKLFDVNESEYIFEYNDVDSQSELLADAPPSNERHTAGPLSTDAEWSTWFADYIVAIVRRSFNTPGAHYQPCIRHPDADMFVSFACGNGFTTNAATQYTYYEKFGGGDLVTLTGLDQVAATDPRYTKTREDGTGGPELIVAGKQSIAGIL